MLIHSGAGRRQGLVVDAVEDIVEWEGEVQGGDDMASRRIVLRDRITDLITLERSAA